MPRRDEFSDADARSTWDRVADAWDPFVESGADSCRLPFFRGIEMVKA